MNSKIELTEIKYMQVKVPIKERWKNAAGVFIAFYFLSIFVIALIEKFSISSWVMVPYITLALVACLKVFFKSNKRVLTPESEKIVAEKMAQSKAVEMDKVQVGGTNEADDLFFSSAWYIRYPIAVVIFSTLIWYASSHNEITTLAWVFIALACFSVLFYAKELVL
jgi:hypothetical protein